jgi:hypothetical protein
LPYSAGAKPEGAIPRLRLLSKIAGGVPNVSDGREAYIAGLVALAAAVMML